MTTTEIKKELYKQKPIATLRYIRNNIAYYYCNVGQIEVEFEVPCNDMGCADFTSLMDAHLLNRWIVDIEA